MSKFITRFTWVLTLLMAATVAKAQSQPVPPDCVVFVSMTANGSGTMNTAAFDNRTWQCQNWTFGYQGVGTGSITTIEVQSAPVAAGGVAGTWVTYAGTVDVGVNPNTSSTGAVTQMHNGAVVTPFMRVLLTEGTFVGPITGVLYGWRVQGDTGSGSGGGGGGSGCPNPCPVIGTTADGAPVTQPPLVTAGVDNASNIQQVLVRTDGAAVPANAAVAGADGVSNTPSTFVNDSGTQLYNRNIPYVFNGSTNDRQFICTNSAPITYSAASGTLQIVGLTAAQIIRICHISLSSNTATNITLVNGTGSNCGTGTTSISGVYQNVLSLSMDFPSGSLRVPSANAFCITSSATATVGGMVVYAKF